jgi:hypothetical protein
VNVIGLQAAVMHHVCLLRLGAICDRQIYHRDQSCRIRGDLNGKLGVSYGVWWTMAQLNQRVPKG